MKSIPFRTAQPSRSICIPSLIQGCGLAALVLAAAIAAPTPEPVSAPAAPHASATASTAAHTKGHRWLQVGTASWYGAQFQGRLTAAGERFDMNSLTCAHPTLPMGTWLKVTNLHNRKTAYVRVNDRGPVPDDRIVDLSYAAARSLRLRGLGKVKLETLSPTDPDLIRGLLADVHIPVLRQPLTRMPLRFAA